jgi:hypothetical protein
MPIVFTKHEKLSLRNHTEFNEKWLHDRICDDPSILGLGEVRVLAREKVIAGGGRLDVLLSDEEEERRYEVEIQLGATDPSHIIRTIEYWDMEQRRYPAYEHVAVIIAENITARFLNVISLLAGSIPIIAIQLDVLKVGDQLLLHFTQVLDQRELRADDTEEDSGGGQANREYWEKKAGPSMMHTCDQALAMVNEFAGTPMQLNFLRGYIGLQSNGVVDNLVTMIPTPTRNYIQFWFRVSDAAAWREKFEAAGAVAAAKRSNRLRVSMSPTDFDEQKELVRQIIGEAVKEFES